MISHADKCVVDALIPASNGYERDAYKGDAECAGGLGDMLLVDGDPTQDII
jgi:hypothetical protein